MNDNEKVCDWGPVSHLLARHYVKYECPNCGVYKVLQLCHNCWDLVNDYENLWCLSCPVPKRQLRSQLYTHMGTP